MAIKISWSKKADVRFYSIISYLVDEFGDVVASNTKAISRNMQFLFC